MILFELFLAAIASIVSICSREQSGLDVLGIGKLVNSPLFESGVTVTISGDEWAAAASRWIKPGGTTVSEFRRITSPCLTCARARLTLPMNPKLRGLRRTSTFGSVPNLARQFAI